MATRQQNRGRRNRDRDQAPVSGCGEGSSTLDESSDVFKIFKEFQKELDHKNDKNEKIVKLSRDITIESKRLIFLLHRVNGNNKAEVLKDAESKLHELHCSKFFPLASELQGQDSYQFLRAFSPGLQEYIEAVTFYYFLKDRELVDAEKIHEGLTESFRNFNKEKASQETSSSTDTAPVDAPNGQTEQPESEADQALVVPMPFTEYMLGVADFTGELMRMAINSVGAGNLNTPKEVTDLMRIIHDAFASFSNAPRELRRKAVVLRQSLQKVENACYNLRVRGSEIPKHMLADVFTSTSTHRSMPEDSFFGENEEMI